MERGRRAGRRLPAGRDRRQAARPGRRAGAACPRAGRRAVHPRLAQAAGRGAVRAARACRPTARARPATRPTPACWPRSASMHPIVEVVERWREQSKLLNTYLDPLPGLIDERRPPAHHLQPDHRRHRPALVDPARTCRTSPSAPPLGREIRSAFVAEPGYQLLSADYSQVELRILAHLSGEPALREAFARGEDIHRATAAQVLGKHPAELTSDGAKPRQGGQLRDHLRHQRVRPVRAAGHLARGGPELHRPLPGPLPGGQPVHAPGDRAGA